jgi:hypothetical protein
MERVTGKVSIWMAIQSPGNHYQWWRHIPATNKWELLNWMQKFLPEWVAFRETVTTTTVVINNKLHVTVSEADIVQWSEVEALRRTSEENDACEEITEMPDLSPRKPPRRN